MENLKQYLEKAQEMWAGFDRNKKIGIAGGAGLLLLLILFFSFSGGKSEVRYFPLYTDLDLKEAGKLTNRLRELNQDFRLGGDGTIILVPEEDRLTLRATLAFEGFPKTGYIGYEVFDEVPLGMTDFLQQVKYQQALEGELKRTIGHLEQVDDVRLHVVIPEASLFTEQQKPTTASILLKTRPRMKLSSEQIEGIQRLVASSVEGLAFENITVLDNEGNLLSREVDPLARLTSKQIEVQRNVEKYLEQRVQQKLNHVMGPDQAVVTISTELNFDQTSVEETLFNPESQIAIAEDRSEESSAEAGTKERTTTNFEINRTIRRITGAVGAIKRLSISLTVNSRIPVIGTPEDEDTQFRDRTPEEIEEVANVVRGAAGLDNTRGDLLTISKFPFAVTDLRAHAERKRKQEERDELITSVVLNVAKAIAIVIALLVLRAIIGAIGRGVAREEEIAMEAQRELDEDDVSEELPETPHELLLGRIAQLISERPEDAAKLIRTMLIEDAQARSRQGA
ncbi:MAG: flagellar basal-body MS-ring/collar protein FliF [bacterium]|nr:flagellar basal-body MS-ring/collar protein FliF [bacterium]